jgi:hypothetical protein
MAFRLALRPRSGRGAVVRRPAFRVSEGAHCQANGIDCGAVRQGGRQVAPRPAPGRRRTRHADATARRQRAPRVERLAADRFTDPSDVWAEAVRDRLHNAQTTEAVNDALRQVIAGIWSRYEQGSLRAEFELRADGPTTV